MEKSFLTFVQKPFLTLIVERVRFGILTSAKPREPTPQYFKLHRTDEPEHILTSVFFATVLSLENLIAQCSEYTSRVTEYTKHTL